MVAPRHLARWRWAPDARASRERRHPQSIITEPDRVLDLVTAEWPKLGQRARRRSEYAKYATHTSTTIFFAMPIGAWTALFVGYAMPLVALAHDVTPPPLPPPRPPHRVEHSATKHAGRRRPTSLGHLHLSGFSESRALIEYGVHEQPGLHVCRPAECSTCTMLDDHECSADLRWRKERNTTFLAVCREERQLRWAAERGTPAIYSEPCARNVSGSVQPFNLSFSWKSFVQSPLDDLVETYLVDKARELPPSTAIIAIYSAGAHHFAMHLDHTSAHQTHNRDSWMPPHVWMDTWVHMTTQLMDRLAGLRDEHGVCTVWRTNNIGKRVEPGNYHNPSVEGAFHDYLNRFAASMARERGIAVVDLTPLTVAMTKAANQKENALAGLSDTDFYHGYSFSTLWRETFSIVLTACGLASSSHSSPESR